MNEALDDLLSEPSSEVIESLRKIDDDILVLGAAGKMGPTLAWLAQRAFKEAGLNRRVLAVSRFSNDEIRGKLESWGVQTIACDLLDRGQVDQLPRVRNIIFMAGRKFGSTGKESLTWAMNAVVPANVCEVFHESRMVAFSTGNVYGLCSVDNGGSLEEDPLAPSGDYAMSCLGRERVFEHYSETLGIPLTLFRLNYACEPRYGVLVDLARKVWNGEVVDVSMGYFNIIWQGDANALALRSLAHAASPPFILNVTGPELLSVRETCEQFGELMDKPVRFRGAERRDAFLSNASKARRLFGRPQVDAKELMRRIADWIAQGGGGLGKPTHFEVRDGKF